MKTVTNILLVIAVILPLVLLFWPFARWDGAAAVILRVIPAFAAQLLLCRMGKRNIIKAIPALLAGAFAVWGMYLYLASPHWSGATVGDLMADYGSPFAACVVALIACLCAKKQSD